MMSGAPNTAPDVLTNIEKLVELLGNLPAECLPGERVSYSMLVAHSVLAAMCLKVDGRGRRFAQMLHDDVFSPLGMTDNNLGVRDDLLPRLCPVRVAHPPPVDPRSEERLVGKEGVRSFRSRWSPSPKDKT